MLGLEIFGTECHSLGTQLEVDEGMIESSSSDARLYVPQIKYTFDRRLL